MSLHRSKNFYMSLCGNQRGQESFICHYAGLGKCYMLLCGALQGSGHFYMLLRVAREFLYVTAQGPTGAGELLYVTVRGPSKDRELLYVTAQGQENFIKVMEQGQ